jgi:phage virion morphogenesis protein
MITLSVEVSSQALQDYLAQLRQGMANMRPVMDSIGMELESRISARFETETDPNGQPWEGWAPWTRENYPEDGNSRLLDRYGDMLASLTHSAAATSARVGFGDPKAAFHEWGTWKMPRRGMLFSDPETGELGAEDEAAVLDIVGVWLNDLAR